MKLLVNATNLVIGGGVQVGVWFIRNCIAQQLDACFAVSPQVFKGLKSLNTALESSELELYEQSPARSKKARKRLYDYANEVEADKVFTVFGPAYVDFVQPHISGFAGGWISHADFQVLKRVYANKPVGALKLLASAVYKAWWIRKADAWIFEAEVAADGLAKRAKLERQKCYVIPNNCAEHFVSLPRTPPPTKRFTLLYFTADYAHKGIPNYLSYARALRQTHPDFDCVFKITLDKDKSASANSLIQAAKQEQLERYFDFCGYIPIDRAVELVDSANVVMQTSYLETFSANYPEAMARGRPLIVSDFKFARDICQDAALYVNPDDAEQVADTIWQLAQQPERQNSLVQKGNKILADLPNNEQRFSRYLSLINQLADIHPPVETDHSVT